jgi:hypothetical protein
MPPQDETLAINVIMGESANIFSAMAPSLEQRVARLESELTQLKSKQSPSEAEKPWWQKMIGMYADDPYFEAAVASGRAYRQASGVMESFAAYLPESDSYSLQEAIETLKEPIAIALERDYTFAEIAQILTAQGIIISEVELRTRYSAMLTVPLESAVRPSTKASKTNRKQQPSEQSQPA